MPSNKISTPTNFNNDIQGRHTNLIPLVVIGLPQGNTQLSHPTFFISTSKGILLKNWSNRDWKPLLLNIPSIKESIDLDKRKYKINSVNLSLSNYEYQGKRLSDEFAASFDTLEGTEVRIFWMSPSVEEITYFDIEPYNSSQHPNRALMVYFGRVAKYNHNDKTINLTLEDSSQSILDTKIPKLISDEYDIATIPKEYKDKAIPMVYGTIKNAPCVISSNRSHPDTANDINSTNEGIQLLFDEKNKGTKALNYITETDQGEDIIQKTLRVFKDNRYLNIYNKVKYDNPNRDELFGYSKDSDQYILTDTSEINFPGARLDEDNLGSSPSANNEIIALEYIAINKMKLNAQNITSNHWSRTNRKVCYSGYKMPDNGGNWVAMAGTVVNWDRTVNSGFDWASSGMYSQVYDIDLNANDLSSIDGGSAWSPTKDQEQVYPSAVFLTDRLSSDFMESDININLDIQAGAFKEEVDGYTVNGDSDGFTLRVGANTKSDGNELFYKDMKLNGVNTYYNTPYFRDWYSGIQGWASTNTSDGNILIYIQPNISPLYQGVSFAGAFLMKFNSLNQYNYHLFRDFAKEKYFIDVVIGRNSKTPNIIANTPTPRSFEIISDIVDRLSGLNSIQLSDNQSLEDDYEDRINNFVLTKQEPARKVIETIASTSPYIPKYNILNNKLSFEKIPLHGGTSQFTIKDEDVIDFTFSKSPIENVITELTFNFDYDYGSKTFLETVTINKDSMPNALSNYRDDYYFKDGRSKVIDDDRGKMFSISVDPSSPYQASKESAIKFAQWYFLFYCNQHLIMKIKLPLSYLGLQVGLIVKFDKIIGDIKPYGINYTASAQTVNGQAAYKTFLITSINKTINYVEIEAMRMHDLDADTVFGCTNPNSTECNYNSSATVDDGSCEFLSHCGNCVPPDLLDAACVYDCNGDLNGTGVFDECGECTTSSGYVAQSCYGCTSPYAINYTPTATINDGSCVFYWSAPSVCPHAPDSDPCISGTASNYICDDPNYSHRCSAGLPDEGKGVWIRQDYPDGLPYSDMLNYFTSGCSGIGTFPCINYYPLVIDSANCSSDHYTGNIFAYLVSYDISFYDTATGHKKYIRVTPDGGLNSTLSLPSEPFGYGSWPIDFQIENINMSCNPCGDVTYSHKSGIFKCDIYMQDNDGGMRHINESNNWGYPGLMGGDYEAFFSNVTIPNQQLPRLTDWNFISEAITNEDPFVFKMRLEIDCIVADDINGGSCDHFSHFKNTHEITITYSDQFCPFLGDVDNGGTVNQLDFQELSACLVNNNCQDVLDFPCAADVDGDGNITGTDSLCIAWMVLNCDFTAWDSQGWYSCYASMVEALQSGEIG